MGPGPRESATLTLTLTPSPLPAHIPQRSDGRTGITTLRRGACYIGVLPCVTLSLSNLYSYLSAESGVTMRRDSRSSITPLGAGRPLCASLPKLISGLSPGLPRPAHPSPHRSTSGSRVAGMVYPGVHRVAYTGVYIPGCT